MPTSKHLEEIIQDKEGCVNTQVVFVDIEKYSLRRTSTQRETIRRFTEISQDTLRNLAKKYITYVEANNLNFSEDIIRIPTGDGLAVVFTFEGLYKIHLDFAELILSGSHEHNCEMPCEKFKDAGWCNCHPNFRLRVAIADGPAVVFKDVNGNYNVAGNPVNLAARMLAYADSGQILLSETAHNNLIQMLPMNEISLEDKFKRFDGVKVKHEVKLSVFQYVNETNEFLNSDAPSDLVLMSRLDKVMEMLPPVLKGMSHKDGLEQYLNMIESLGISQAPMVPGKQQD